LLVDINGYFQKGRLITLPLEELFGFIGGTLIVAAMIPQVWRLFKLRSAREISLTYTILSLTGALFWLTYGLILQRPSLIYANSISIVLVVLMLTAKLKWGRIPSNEKHP
jgi:MtN3 and saliva related transmembrane protein